MNYRTVRTTHREDNGAYERGAYAEESDANGRQGEDTPDVRQVDDEFHRTLCEEGMSSEDMLTGHAYTIESLTDDVDLDWLLHTTPAKLRDPRRLLMWQGQHTRHGERGHWCGLQVYDYRQEALRPALRATLHLVNNRQAGMQMCLYNYDGTLLVGECTLGMMTQGKWLRHLQFVDLEADMAPDTRTLTKLLRREPALRELTAAVLWTYLTTPDVARTRYAALRGWWNESNEQALPWNYLDDVQWDDVQAVLDGHPLTAWEARNGREAFKLTDAEIWGRKPVRERRIWPVPTPLPVSRVVPVDVLWGCEPTLPQVLGHHSLLTMDEDEQTRAA